MVTQTQTCAGHEWQPEPDDPQGERPMRCYACGTTEAEAARG